MGKPKLSFLFTLLQGKPAEVNLPILYFDLPQMSYFIMVYV